MSSDSDASDRHPRDHEDENAEDLTDALLRQFSSAIASVTACEEENQRILQGFLAALARKPKLTETEREFLHSPVPKPLETADIAGVAKFIKEGHAKNIIVMCGAGISVSAGIPDFRTPGTGLYYNLQKYHLDDPQKVFSLEHFNIDPMPFYEVARGIYPGEFHPTLTHYFIRLLHEHGLLLRDFTQNIDTLEIVSGIPMEKTVFSHGSFAKAHCVKCHKEFTYQYVREKIFSDPIQKVECDNEECDGCVKPDIVFFGEKLPDEFFNSMREDFPKCDLLIIMGTSLAVQPFASLIGKVPESVPRLLINLEEVSSKPAPPGETATEEERYRYRVSSRFAFNDPDNRRDAFFKGPCDEGVQILADALGWGEELKKAYSEPVTFFKDVPPPPSK